MEAPTRGETLYEGPTIAIGALVRLSIPSARRTMTRVFREGDRPRSCMNGRGELPVHMSNAVHSLLIGRTLAKKYTIESLIGTGGMGAVYRARQISLGRSVAVKVLHRELADEPKFVARFEREALSASHLDHPNSLRVLDFGEDQGLLYLVMEYVDAEDLLALMNREWPLDDERVVSMLSQLLAALAVAHDLGIVHRDLKPGNILVLPGVDDDGEPVDIVKICDFGVAKVEPRGKKASGRFAPHLTVDGLAVGTPDYMSPEQARGESVDGRSDVYSVGVVLYHLLAGRTPFVGESALGVALQHVSDDPLPPSHHRDVHPALEAICLRALSKLPRDRFQSARAMRRALRSALDEERRTSYSTPPLVLTRPAIATPRFGSSSPTELAAARAHVARRTLGSRIRQAAAASAGGALLALGIAASVPAIRHTVEQTLRRRFEMAQTAAAALIDPSRAMPARSEATGPVETVNSVTANTVETAVADAGSSFDVALPPP